MTHGRYTDLERRYTIDEEERRSMRQYVDGLGKLAHLPSAFSKLVGVSAGDTLYHASRMTPS